MKSPKIELPNNLKIIGKLERKAKEYVKRYIKYKKKLAKEYSYWSPERIDYTAKASDSFCKKYILENLLEQKEISKDKIKKKLKKESKKYFSEGNFGFAWSVIKDYCKTGGKNNIGGTGLR